MSNNNFFKERWESARVQQKSYFELTGDDSISVKEFFKNENPMTEKIVKLEITFEMNYKGENYEFFIPQGSISVFALDSPEIMNMANENVKSSIASLFKGKAQNFIYNNTEINITKKDVRGVEKNKISSDTINEIDYDRIVNTGSYFEDKDKVVVGKGINRNKANKNIYDLDLWL